MYISPVFSCRVTYFAANLHDLSLIIQCLYFILAFIILESCLEGWNKCATFLILFSKQVFHDYQVLSGVMLNNFETLSLLSVL